MHRVLIIIVPTIFITIVNKLSECSEPDSINIRENFLQILNDYEFKKIYRKTINYTGDDFPLGRNQLFVIRTHFSSQKMYAFIYLKLRFFKFANMKYSYF